MPRNTIGRIVALPVMLSLVATPALAEKADQLTTLTGLEAAGVEIIPMNELIKPAGND